MVEMERKPTKKWKKWNIKTRETNEIKGKKPKLIEKYLFKKITHVTSTYKLVVYWFKVDTINLFVFCTRKRCNKLSNSPIRVVYITNIKLNILHKMKKRKKYATDNKQQQSEKKKWAWERYIDHFGINHWDAWLRFEFKTHTSEMEFTTG